MGLPIPDPVIDILTVLRLLGWEEVLILPDGDAISDDRGRVRGVGKPRKP
jgi:hypothetical protein